MARKFINVKKKFYEEALDFWKSLSKSPSEEFLVPPKKDQRGWLAKKIDFLAVRILFFFLTATLVSIYFSMKIAIIAALVLTWILHLVLRRSESSRINRYQQDMVDYIAKDYVYGQIMKMNPETEFSILISQVLNNLDGFSEVQAIRTPNESSIDLIGKFKDVAVGINCNRYKKENEVGRPELLKFASGLRKAGLTRGIFLTTSSFSEWAIDYVQSVKEELRIVLVDKEKLLEWICISQHSIYPNAERVEELEQKRLEQERMVSLRKREGRNKGLMQAFFLVSFYLTVLSLLMKNWLQEWMLYLYFSAAILNMLLGFTCYLFFKHTRAQIKQFYVLEQLD